MISGPHLSEPLSVATRRAVREELRAAGVTLLHGNPCAALELVRRLGATADGLGRGWYAHRDSAFYVDENRAA